MWPYTDTEQNWLAHSARPLDAPLRQPLPGLPDRKDHEAPVQPRGAGEAADPIPDIVRREGQEHLYRLAESLASALVGTTSRIARGLARLRPPPARGTAVATPAELGEALRQPLTSIRSAAEILRDNPTLAPDQRARMLGLIVAESERLDRLIGTALEPA
jgi:signal transduction histidine kinase